MLLHRLLSKKRNRKKINAEISRPAETARGYDKPWDYR